MAQAGARVRGSADLSAVPPQAADTVSELHGGAAPASSADAINPPTHPSSRKPDGQGNPNK
jgi:hypothetical protein